MFDGLKAEMIANETQLFQYRFDMANARGTFLPMFDGLKAEMIANETQLFQYRFDMANARGPSYLCLMG